MYKFIKIVLILVLALSISSCAVSFYSGRPSDRQKIELLSSEIEKLRLERQAEQGQLKEAQAILAERLKKEINGKQLKLELAQRGLVITFVDEVLFDSGKDVIKDQANSILDKVSEVAKEKASDKNISIEGYTDNQPIRYSRWKSNWELSTARAVSVLHYLENKGIDPRRLQATGYGEYRPVATNGTKVGRQKNRRVEVIILPNILEVLPFESSRVQESQDYK